MVKRQVEGLNDDEILRFSYLHKADETRNPMKQKSSIWTYDQSEILVLRLVKILTQFGLK